MISRQTWEDLSGFIDRRYHDLRLRFLTDLEQMGPRYVDALSELLLMIAEQEWYWTLPPDEQAYAVVYTYNRFSKLVLDDTLGGNVDAIYGSDDASS